MIYKLDSNNDFKEDYLSAFSNPFEDYFMVNSQQTDIFILQSLGGTIIGKYKVGKGETRITEILLSGLFIGRLQNQNQTL
ncbi:hypothetical protein ERX46_12940 [Brumimicrobium glaciale]|uniref:Uncharacterized protein n=1 Tax=Brumimicrobium glaciale TaxID=200475 RepID=A0A4Q4KKV1_9FLAO|nr:hypothetical protein [Brumimicrobium glaciale]RYM32954.1 hypothetical protein ERX46_12940 [Brumimicrobium glaciale]